MVQTYQSPLRVYKHPFELVMLAYERRFPTTPLIPLLVGCEVLSDAYSEDSAERITERRFKLIVEAPYLIKKIISTDFVYFLQRNELDARARTLEIESKNETFSNRVIVLEKCRYFVHPENSDWTCFEQNAELDVRSFFGFESTIEKLAMKQYITNISKGKEILEHYIEVLREEGITYIPPWKPPETKNEVCDELSKLDLKSDGTVEEHSLDKLRRQGSMSPSGTKRHELEFQLEDDYIRRCLGELDPMQESKLIQFKKQIWFLQKGKLPTDSTLLRFLKSKDYNIEKARESLSQSLTWRKCHNVDQILQQYEAPPVVRAYFTGAWHHCDKEMRPLYLFKLGNMDVKGFLKTIGEDGLLKLAMRVCEEGLSLTEEYTRKHDRPITTWSLLIDLEGLNMRHLWRPGVKALLRIIEIVETNYPETLGRVLIIRAPRMFPILWTLVSTFIDETTRSKFLVYAGNDYQSAGGLIDYIEQDYIPDFLGGPCETKLPEGGLIPKSLYMSDADWEAGKHAMVEDTVYHSVSISRNHPVHEVILNIDAPGAVITWDFDVMKQDVVFNVLSIHKTVESIAPVSGLSLIDKAWTEGVDYECVETPILCHDGESIQGSHVTSRDGIYILQWKFCSDSVSTGMDTSSLIGGVAKAQVMYYYEILPSQHYRGSMSSLQSAHSGFSALSMKGGASR
uniref:SEC14-like protein 1 n=1 Tax=Cacopsylla melanoneura TaxID=428564 RepID=A0A8D9A6R2_9HEMI